MGLVLVTGSHPDQELLAILPAEEHDVSLTDLTPLRCSGKH
jgi:hypothetical protein